MLQNLEHKYGKTKLKKFLTEIHPYLNKQQQKLNIKHIKKMSFGAAAIARQKAEAIERINTAYEDWVYNKTPTNYTSDITGNEQYRGSLHTAGTEIPDNFGSGGPNFILRSEIILWRHKLLNNFDLKYTGEGGYDKINKSYKARGNIEMAPRHISELVQLLLTAILVHYDSRPEIGDVAEDYWDYMRNADCLIAQDETQFIGIETELGNADTDFAEIIKAELIIMLMRIFDMIHDFVGARTKNDDDSKEEKEEKEKLTADDVAAADTAVDYLTEFIQQLITIKDARETGKSYRVKFYSFSYSRYFYIVFPATPDDRRPNNFPSALFVTE